jgi:hypothetical protein
MSHLTPIYTIYSLPYTTFGLDVRHTGQAGKMAVLLGSLNDVVFPLLVASYYHSRKIF